MEPEGSIYCPFQDSGSKTISGIVVEPGSLNGQHIYIYICVYIYMYLLGKLPTSKLPTSNPPINGFYPNSISMGLQGGMGPWYGPPSIFKVGPEMLGRFSCHGGGTSGFGALDLLQDVRLHLPLSLCTTLVYVVVVFCRCFLVLLLLVCRLFPFCWWGMPGGCA